MTSTKLGRREIPWCSLCLVILSLTCHVCVLIGNMKTASAMRTMGSSTGGWSRVGLGLSRSLTVELDALMSDVSAKLINSTADILDLQGTLDSTLSLVGNGTDEAISQGAQLLQLQSRSTASNSSDNTSEKISKVLEPAVLGAVRSLVTTLTGKLNDVLDSFLVRIRPALIQVGDWIIKFGDKIQSSIDAFSTSLDKAQKTFDQVMAELHGHGGDGDSLFHETYTLFDVSGTGSVTTQDLRDVSELFSIQALAGTKAEELLEKYDSDGDGALNQAETRLMVDDETIPDSMSSVLRTYAKKLTEVSKKTAAGVMRDEVAQAVVQYFQLVCAKNQTKVGWVSDALGNGSLIVNFTAAVYAQLCLSEGSPDVLTKADIGQMVISRMYSMHAGQTAYALSVMSDPEYWTLNGFDPLDQPRCVGRLTEWMNQARRDAEGTALVELESASAAELRAKTGMNNYLVAKSRARAAHQAALFSGRTSRVLLAHLSGGATASSSNPNAERAISAGQPAVPSTLLFAKWLAANASATADRFQDLCFSYSSTSSNKLDNFATQIQSMVKQVSSFIAMMETWATPAGIDRLETIVRNFTRDVEGDLLRIIETKVGDLLDMATPLIGDSLDSVGESVAEQLGGMIGNVLEGPIESALTDPLESVAEDILGPEIGADMGDILGPMVGETISNLTTKVLEDQLQGIVDNLVDKALDAASNLTIPIPGMALLEVQSDVHMEKLDMELSGVWSTLTGMLSSLSNLVPTATQTLKLARTQVSGAAGNLGSIFALFQEKGPSIFSLIAKFWTLIWVLYFFFLTPLTLFNGYYAFWASGWFGGPQPADENDGAAPPRTWGGRLRICCRTCGVCMTHFHDTQTCFWSCVILMHVITLLIFIISILLCLLAGIKAFIVAGCAQIYIIADGEVCMSTIETLRNFLGTFFVKEALEPLVEVCDANDLLMCKLISAKMKTSMILTTVFSMLATVLSMQLLIENAIMHEQARYRRLFNQKLKEEEEKVASVPS